MSGNSKPAVLEWRDAFRQSSAPAAVRNVMLALAEYADNNSLEAWPSETTIAKDAGVSARTVRRNMNDAKAHGWVVLVKRGHSAGRAGGRGTANHYRLAFGVSWVPESPATDVRSLTGDDEESPGIDDGITGHERPESPATGDRLTTYRTTYRTSLENSDIGDADSGTCPSVPVPPTSDCESNPDCLVSAWIDDEMLSSAREVSGDETSQVALNDVYMTETEQESAGRFDAPDDRGCLNLLELASRVKCARPDDPMIDFGSFVDRMIASDLKGSELDSLMSARAESAGVSRFQWRIAFTADYDRKDARGRSVRIASERDWFLLIESYEIATTVTA